MTQINEMIIAYNMPDDLGSGGSGEDDSDAVSDEAENSGTVIMDAASRPKISVTHRMSIP